MLDNAYGDKSFNNYLNRAAFAEPALGTLGNLQRNALVGPVTKVVDLSLVRLFPMGRHAIEARVEAFNAFNWFNPSENPLTINNSPVVNYDNAANFGKILAAGDPRIMQFALKYSF